jgi:hypothetical protein
LSNFIFQIRLEILKLCVVQDYANMEFLLAYALKVEKVLGKLGETPFEPLMEEQMEMMQGT